MKRRLSDEAYDFEKKIDEILKKYYEKDDR